MIRPICSSDPPILPKEEKGGGVIVFVVTFYKTNCSVECVELIPYLDDYRLGVKFLFYQRYGWFPRRI